MSWNLLRFGENGVLYFREHRKVGILTGAVGLLLLVKALRGSKKHTTPLVPYTWPIIGSSAMFSQDPEFFLKQCVQQYGPMFRAHIGGSIKTVISGKLSVEILHTSDFNFPKGIQEVFDLQLLLGIKDDVPERELIRKIASKLTLRLPELTSSIVKNIEIGQTRFMESRLEKAALSSNEVRGLLIHMLALSSACAFLDRDTINKHPDIIEAFAYVVPAIAKILSTGLMGAVIPAYNTFRTWLANKTDTGMKNHKRVLYRAIRPIVERRLLSGERIDDLVQLAIDAKAKDTTDVEIVAQHVASCISILIFASMHTTSSSATVTFYNLVKNPWLVEELLLEQQEVLKKHGISPDEQDPARRFTAPVLKDLVKLDSTIRESLRTRKFYLQHPHRYEGKSDYVLSNGLTIKPGETVLLANWINHHDPTLADTEGHNLDEFRPFRFVGTDLTATRVKANFLVFASGQHTCPGRFFAVQQIKILLSILIFRYTLTPTTPVVIPQLPAHALPYGDVLLEKRKELYSIE
ncbi:cytochrome P450 [Dichotomocladium elegans]|nr:cytochrome P450 [Dichotomocladium elegans]